MKSTGLKSLMITIVLLGVFLVAVFFWEDELEAALNASVDNDIEAQISDDDKIIELLSAMDKAHKASEDLAKAIEQVEKIKKCN